MFGEPRKPLPQLLFLGGDPHRAVIGVADPRHNAALGNHGDGAKAKLLGPHQGSHDHIPAGFETAIDPQQDAIAQLVFE